MTGSSDLAGLNEPPDAGPIASAAVKMKRPISRGAMTPFHGARSSVATVEITITKRRSQSSRARARLRSRSDARGSVERVGRLLGVHGRHRENGDEPSDEVRDPVRDYLLSGRTCSLWRARGTRRACLERSG